MKISVVTISFNQAQFLSECIDSVLNQNYSDIELWYKNKQKKVPQLRDFRILFETRLIF